MINTSESKDEYVLPNELAKELRCHPETIRRLLRSGALAGYRVASNFVIPRTSVVAYLATTRTRKAA
jgi:excisionase family DNA binding protein